MRLRRVHTALSVLLLAGALAGGVPVAVSAAPSVASVDEEREAIANAGGCGKIITQPNANETRYWWRNCKDGYGGDYVETDIIWGPNKYHCVPPGETWHLGSSFKTGPNIGETRDLFLVKTDCPY